MAYQQIGLNVELYDRLKAKARELGVSMTQVVKIGLNLIDESEKWIPKEEKK